MIYTTYFSNIRNLPVGVVPISIARSHPAWWNGLEYKALAPTWDILNVYKRTNDWEAYEESYTATVLRERDVEQTYKELCALAGCENIALVCWEAKGKHCHRHIDAKWFNDAGYPCMEW